MVQRQSGDAYANAYCNETVTHAKRVVRKATVLITLFQDTHLVKAMLMMKAIYKLCVQSVILRKGGGFLAET
jgi:hypothetical protein